MERPLCSYYPPESSLSVLFFVCFYFCCPETVAQPEQGERSGRVPLGALRNIAAASEQALLSRRCSAFAATAHTGWSARRPP